MWKKVFQAGLILVAVLFCLPSYGQQKKCRVGYSYKSQVLAKNLGFFKGEMAREEKATQQDILFHIFQQYKNPWAKKDKFDSNLSIICSSQVPLLLEELSSPLNRGRIHEVDGESEQVLYRKKKKPVAKKPSQTPQTPQTPETPQTPKADGEQAFAEAKKLADQGGTIEEAIEGYRKYLTSYPQGKHVSEATSAILVLARKRLLQQQDQNAYAKARLADQSPQKEEDSRKIIQEYEKYLKLYPEGLYLKEVHPE